MRIAEIVMAVLLGAASVYLMWKSGEGPSWDPTVPRYANIGFDETGAPGSGFWPFWLSLIMLGSCVWTIWNAINRLTPPSQSSEPFLDGYSIKMLVLVGGGLLAFLALIGWLGFYAAIFLFLMYYLVFLGRRPLRQSLTIAVLTPVISFFFFDVAMRIVLPKGITEPLFIPLYDIFL